MKERTDAKVLYIDAVSKSGGGGEEKMKTCKQKTMGERKTKNRGCCCSLGYDKNFNIKLQPDIFFKRKKI